MENERNHFYLIPQIADILNTDEKIVLLQHSLVNIDFISKVLFNLKEEEQIAILRQFNFEKRNTLLLRYSLSQRDHIKSKL